MNETIKSCLVKASFNFVIACAAYFPARADEGGDVQEILDLELMSVDVDDGLIATGEEVKASSDSLRETRSKREVERLRILDKPNRKSYPDYMKVAPPEFLKQANRSSKAIVSTLA